MLDTITNINTDCRISALGIVGDLLKKVGALELKLVWFFRHVYTSFYINLYLLQVSCRNIVKENGEKSSDKNGFSSLTIDRSKKIPRGASSPAVKNICDENT